MNLRIEKLGWIVAGGLATFFIASGFDTPSAKLGVVDVSKAITESDFYKKSSDDIQSAYKLRGDVLEYINTYPVFTVAQATRFKDLSLKPQPTTAETAELNKLKTDVKDADTKYRELQQKQNPTPADRQALDDFGKRVQALGQLVGQWRQQFADDLQAMQDKAGNANQEAARVAIQEIGKNQSFNLIFVKDVAPYGQNDVTADVLKAMNKK